MKSFIVSAGFRGTGNTTTGRILLQRLGWAADTDDWIQSKDGESIPRPLTYQMGARYPSVL